MTELQLVKTVWKCNNPKCDATFERKSDLGRHVQIHNPVRKFKCPYLHCPRRFNQVVQLKTHVNKHTGAKPHRCKFCPKVFSDGSARTRHTQAIHGRGAHYACTECGKLYVRKGVFIKHMAKAHGIDLKVDEKGNGSASQEYYFVDDELPEPRREHFAPSPESVGLNDFAGANAQCFSQWNGSHESIFSPETSASASRVNDASNLAVFEEGIPNSWLEPVDWDMHLKNIPLLLEAFDRAALLDPASLIDQELYQHISILREFDFSGCQGGSGIQVDQHDRPPPYTYMQMAAGSQSQSNGDHGKAHGLGNNQNHSGDAIPIDPRLR